MFNGETNLQALLEQLSPELLPDFFLFHSSKSLPQEIDLNHIFAIVKEKEGFTLVLSESNASHFLKLETNAKASERYRCIALGVHSSLEAVGLTAAVSAALAEAGIAANIIAGFYHDYIFIPERDAEQALKCLLRLQEKG